MSVESRWEKGNTKSLEKGKSGEGKGVGVKKWGTHLWGRRSYTIIFNDNNNNNNNDIDANLNVDSSDNDNDKNKNDDD